VTAQEVVPRGDLLQLLLAGCEEREKGLFDEQLSFPSYIGRSVLFPPYFI
jgi:hypothetical protein